MRLSTNAIVLLFCSLLIAFSATSMLVAQTDSDRADESQVQSEDERLEQMLDKRRDQMNQRLKSLTRSEESMGANHPSLAKVRTQIKELEKELEAWSSPTDSLLDMSDRDLRALVLQLAIRVDRLESRSTTSAASGQQNRGLIKAFSGR